MPYKDPDKHREYDRERKRLVRAGASNPRPTQVEPAFRVRVMEDVMALLERAVQLAESDAQARDIEKSRALGFLASVALRAVETSDLAVRLEALEQVLKGRKAG